MTHVPYYPHNDPRQNWVHISSPIAAPDSLLPLYMPPSPTPVDTPTIVNNTHVNTNVNNPNEPHIATVPNVNNSTNSSKPPTPAQLADLLYPRLLHQHSLLTSIQDLLDPLHPSPIIPVTTLHTTHKLLQATPHLLDLLPPLPLPHTRPPRAPPLSYADPNDPQPLPTPCHPTYPFGEAEGVAVAPSNLTTQDSNAGMGLYKLRPKRPQYAKCAHLHHLFARKGDFICSYHGPTRTPTECVTQPSMYLFSDPADPHHRYIDS